MSGSRNTPIRFTEDTIDRLDRVAQRLGMNRSQVVKFCTTSFLDAFERQGISILPDNWREILHSNDGRVARHHTEISAADVKGPVTQIGTQTNFTSGTTPRGGVARIKNRRQKK